MELELEDCGQEVTRVGDVRRDVVFRGRVEVVLGSRDAATVLELAQRCDQLPDIRQLLNATVPTQSKTDKSRARQPVS